MPYIDGRYVPEDSDEWKNFQASQNPDPTTDSEPGVHQTEEIAFLNGNRHSPVLHLGDDPSNETNGTDNVLVVPLGIAQSVPREQVSTSEGTPEAS